jgi:hypothetical protein
MAATCPEERGATVITGQDTRKLLENADVMSDFENIYSLTCVSSTPPPIFAP